MVWVTDSPAPCAALRPRRYEGIGLETLTLTVLTPISTFNTGFTAAAEKLTLHVGSSSFAFQDAVSKSVSRWQ